MDHLDDRIHTLFHRLELALSNIDGIELKRDFFTQYANFTVVFDAVILNKGELLAIIESKPYTNEIEKNELLFEKGANDLAYKFRIITNGIKIILQNNYDNTTRILETVHELVKEMFNLPTHEELEKLKHEIAQVLNQEARNFTSKAEKSAPKSKIYSRVIDHFDYENILQSLYYDSNGQYFRLGSDIRLEENFENVLFNILLEDLTVDALIYRYASLETVFATVNGGKMRMNGIAGMNDTSEVEYVDQYLDKTYSLFATPKEFKAMNNRFISCCSTLEDSLNQWRLYGDDCEGACLVFKIYQASPPLPGLRIKKVSYGSSSRSGKPYHLELELIKHLIEKVKEITGQLLKIKSLDIWKHFFKPYEYKEEKEVRLLMVLNEKSNIKGSPIPYNKEWNLTASHKIIAPFLTIALNEPVLPIKLKKITLGSKSPEKQLNQAQLTLLLNEKHMPDVEVNISKINNYR